MLARVPLASEYLSGKYKPGAVFSSGDVRSKHDMEETTKLMKEVEKIRASEVPEDVPMATWALAWCLKHPAVTSVIPGCKNPEQVELNARAADLVEDHHPQSVNLS